jgi:hypothetical protein
MKIDLKPEKPEIIDFKKPEIIIPIAVIFFAIIFVIYKMFFEKPIPIIDLTTPVSQIQPSTSVSQIPVSQIQPSTSVSQIPVSQIQPSVSVFVTQKPTEVIAKVDCEVGPWGDCTNGFQRRQITKPAIGEGKACPPSSQECSDCQVEWTPCINNTQRRQITKPAIGEGKACPPLHQICSDCEVGQWGDCINGTQRRQITKPATGAVPACPLISRKCVQLQIINTPLDLIKSYSSKNIDHFIDNEEIVNLYEIFLTKLPVGLKNLIICDNNVLDNKNNVYNIVKCIKGQMYWWWLDNAYGQTKINIDDINIVMLIIIWLLIMIEENKTTVKEIMIYDETTNKVTLISDSLKKLFEESDQYRRQNNHVMDIMEFHAIFKQYMVKSKDNKKIICDCKEIVQNEQLIQVKDISSNLIIPIKI